MRPLVELRVSAAAATGGLLAPGEHALWATAAPPGAARQWPVLALSPSAPTVQSAGLCIAAGALATLQLRGDDTLLIAFVPPGAPPEAAHASLELTIEPQQRARAQRLVDLFASYFAADAGGCDWDAGPFVGGAGGGDEKVEAGGGAGEDDDDDDDEGGGGEDAKGAPSPHRSDAAGTLDMGHVASVLHAIVRLASKNRRLRAGLARGEYQRRTISSLVVRFAGELSAQTGRRLPALHGAFVLPDGSVVSPPVSSLAPPAAGTDFDLPPPASSPTTAAAAAAGGGGSGHGDGECGTAQGGQQQARGASSSRGARTAAAPGAGPSADSVSTVSGAIAVLRARRSTSDARARGAGGYARVAPLHHPQPPHGLPPPAASPQFPHSPPGGGYSTQPPLPRSGPLFGRHGDSSSGFAAYGPAALGTSTPPHGSPVGLLGMGPQQQAAFVFSPTQQAPWQQLPPLPALAPPPPWQHAPFPPGGGGSFPVQQQQWQQQQQGQHWQQQQQRQQQQQQQQQLEMMRQQAAMFLALTNAGGQ